MRREGRLWWRWMALLLLFSVWVGEKPAWCIACGKHLLARAEHRSPEERSLPSFHRRRKQDGGWVVSRTATLGRKPLLPAARYRRCMRAIKSRVAATCSQPAPHHPSSIQRILPAPPTPPARQMRTCATSGRRPEIAHTRQRGPLRWTQRRPPRATSKGGKFACRIFFCACSMTKLRRGGSNLFGLGPGGCW